MKTDIQNSGKRVRFYLPQMLLLLLIGAAVSSTGCVPVSAPRLKLDWGPEPGASGLRSSESPRQRDAARKFGSRREELLQQELDRLREGSSKVRRTSFQDRPERIEDIGQGRRMERDANDRFRQEEDPRIEDAENDEQMERVYRKMEWLRRRRAMRRSEEMGEVPSPASPYDRRPSSFTLSDEPRLRRPLLDGPRKTATEVALESLSEIERLELELSQYEADKKDLSAELARYQHSLTKATQTAKFLDAKLKNSDDENQKLRRELNLIKQNENLQTGKNGVDASRNHGSVERQ